jgi:hypothetical protein
MSSTEDPSAVRRNMIEAIEQNKWEFTKRALREGLDAFRDLEENPSDTAMIDYILDLLEKGYPFEDPPVELKDPPYGTGYEMIGSHCRPDGRPLYIKLKLDWPFVIVVSFHYSNRPGGG